MTRRVLITGAASGIGAATARELAQDSELILHSRRPEQARDIAQELGARQVAFDLRDLTAAATALADIDHLDAIVHSAAIAPNTALAEASESLWQEAFAINVIAPAELTRLLLPQLRAAAGTVVFVNSGAGLGTRPGAGAVYSATKFALRGLADLLRDEEREYGLRVSTVYPGPTDTPMSTGLRGDEVDRDRYLRPETLAKAIAFAIRATDDAQIVDINVRPRRELNRS